MKTSELTGTALDWAVALIEKPGVIGVRQDGKLGTVGGVAFSPSTNWTQGGPIIEREGISTEYTIDPDKWCASITADQEVYGPTHLIAAMRCYVASKLGGSVGVPDALA